MPQRLAAIAALSLEAALVAGLASIARLRSATSRRDEEHHAAL